MKFRKRLSILAVAGILGYLCWPYLDDPQSPPKPKEAKPAETLASLLVIRKIPALDRDAFGPPPSAVAAVGQKPAEKTAPRDNGLGELVLNGTYVGGEHRMAVINGSLYSEGEQIKTAKKVACVVASVHVDKVVLRVDDRIGELTYTDGVAKPGLRFLDAPSTGAGQIPAKSN